MTGGKITQQEIVPGRRQLLARRKHLGRSSLMHGCSSAQWHSQKWPRVYRSAIFQQSEEEVRAEADAGVANYTNLITSGDCAFAQ
jgi:hypothetical protein